MQYAYVKIAVIRGTYAKEYNAKIREALGDNILLYGTRNLGKGSGVTR